MKQFISLTGILVLLSFFSFAQNDITTPQEITTLPYSITGQTTIGTVDDYGPEDACESTAMENEDYVFSFTPDADMLVHITLSNTELVSQATISLGATIGLFVIDGDPTDPASNCVASIDTEEANPELDLVSLTSGTTYYIIVSSEDESLIIQTYPTNVNFDFEMYEIFADDAGITDISGVSSDCGMSTETITCTIRNYGTNTITSLDVSYSVDGGTAHTETFTGNILAGNSSDFTFTTPADFTGEGTHTFEVYTELTGDENPANDTYEISIVNSPVFSTLPYSEGFEGTESYWSPSPGSSWAIGIPNDTLAINEAFEGDYILATNPEGNANNESDSVVVSPCFDFSASGGVKLSFAVWHSPSDLSLLLGVSMGVQTSIDGGATWTTLDSWVGNSQAWLEKTYDIFDFAGESDCKIRFYFQETMPGEGLAIDNIMIEEMPANDAGVTEITNIPSDCGMTTETISCTIKNFGTATITSMDVAYTVDGGTANIETYTGSLAFGEETSFTFTTPADLSATGNHDIEVYTLLTDDENADNDTMSISVVNAPVLSTLPYSEGFEGPETYWTCSDLSSWEIAETIDTLTINSAFEGDFVAITNADGNADNNGDSLLISPCFDFSSTVGVTLSFAVWHEPGLLGANMGVQTSIDGGTTWNTVDTWTGSSAGWLEKTYNISDFGGEADCKIRFYYNETQAFLAGEGMAIDNIMIDEMTENDVAVIGILSPTSSCALGDAEILEVLIKNYGVADQTGFDVSYSIDGGTSWETESFTGTISYDEEESFTFSTPLDLSGIDSYEIMVKTELASDENTDNDQMSQIINHSDVISAFPYIESFESGDGNWSADGINSSLELGEPDATIINAASEGTQAWVTNLTGNHNAAETSYLISPCFDFSSLINPTIDADINYNTMMMTSGMIMEYTLDNGISWDTLPTGGASENWYGADLLSGTSWNGNSTGWITAHNSMEVLAGESNVQLRFTFTAGEMSFGNYEGVGIDNINITDCTDLPVAAFDYTFLTETEVKFINESTNYDSVQWNFGDNELLPSTSNEVNPSFDYGAEGSYTVTLTVYNDCGSDETSQVVEIVIINIENAYSESIQIFPNPVNGILNIDGQGIKAVKVFSVDGKCLINRALEGEKEINTIGLESGLYILQVEAESGIHTLQFIKE
jgi:hypothetical protein